MRLGIVVEIGKGVSRLKPGNKIGISWLGYTCGICKYCRTNRENLCVEPGFTGYTIDGGYATYTVAWEQFCFLLAERYANTSGAPLMCAGMIGYRSYGMIPEESKKSAFMVLALLHIY